MSPQGTLVLAIDAGGSNTRAVVVDADARCLGYGASSSGNPTAIGPVAALRAIGAAGRAALEEAGAAPEQISRTVLAAAGATDQMPDPARELGLHPGAIQHVGDVLGMYHSAAVEPAGIAIVSGTGAVAGRISTLVVERVHDGLGWLLGDAGSGFSIGRDVVRAVAADLDGTGPTTALTPLVLGHYGLANGGTSRNGRPEVLLALLRAVYDDAPVRLARLAPLAFQADDDAVASRIVDEADAALASLVRRVRDGHGELPVVVGGSVLTEGMLARGDLGALGDALAGADVRRARDGVAGAAVVGLLALGVQLDADRLRRLAADIAGRQGPPPASLPHGSS
ncbi:BadF/BadG/BcrA/BcrD ATPase family protein [Georgenia halophila]|uniref:BadF/BadG/BcrA/BcrD ATPase family protein n=1 Tax=Georgenia halophila TaxID=620889 RepID=A0ABP8L9Z8_9MICO